MRPQAFDPRDPDEVADDVWSELLSHDVGGEYDDAPANDDPPTAAELSDGDDEWAADDLLTTMRAMRAAEVAPLDARHGQLLGESAAQRRARWYLEAEGTLEARSELARSLAASANDNDAATGYAREAARLTERAAEMRAARVAVGGWVCVGRVGR